MAKVPIQIGNIKVPDDKITDFNAMLRSYFGKKITRTRGVDGGRPETVEENYTDAELAQKITDENRQIWRERFRDWKRQTASDVDIELS